MKGQLLFENAIIALVNSMNFVPCIQEMETGYFVIKCPVSGSLVLGFKL